MTRSTASPVPRLRVRTTRIGDASAASAPLLDALPAGTPPDAPLAWVREGEGMVGLGRVARVDTSGAGRFADARAWWAEVVAAADVHDEVSVPGTGLVAFGSFAFAADSPAGAALIVPATVLGRRGDVAWHTDVVDLDAPVEAPVGDSPSSAAESAERQPGAGRPEPAGAAQNLSDTPPSAPSPTLTMAEGSVSTADFTAAVARGVAAIAAGGLDKLVLARDLLAQSDTPFDVARVVRALAAGYPRTWAFAVDGLVGATPELLVRLDRGLVTSRVLAGTIRRTGDDAADLALAASLARSSKDLEEHEYAVRSVADALRGHCTSMSVPETPFVLHLPNVMHLATDVAGRTSNGAGALDLAEALHPSAAVCGTPRVAAGEAIARIEGAHGMDRGRYAGPVGWIDHTGDGEWGIALRCGAVDPAESTRMRLFAGCGIVAGSDPAAELAESEAKFVPMRGALLADRGA